MLSEAPLLASDVVSPKTFAENRHLKGSTVQDTGIPILSWSRGSPFDPIKALQPKSRGKASDLLSPNNMENYFCAPTGKEEKDDEDREEDDRDDDGGEENGNVDSSLMTGPDLGIVQQKLDYGTGNDSSIFEESPTTKSEVSFGANDPMNTVPVDTSDGDPIHEHDVVEEESAVIFGTNYGDEDASGNDDGEEAEEVEDRLTAEQAANSLYSSNSVDPFSYNFPTQEVDTSVVEELAMNAGEDDRFADGPDRDQEEEEEEDEEDDDYDGYPANDFDRLSQDSLGSASLAGDGSVVMATGEDDLEEEEDPDDDQDDDDKEEGTGAGDDALEGTLASYLGLIHNQGDAVNVLSEAKLDEYASEILRSAKKGGSSSAPGGFDLDSIIREYDAVMSAGKHRVGSGIGSRGSHVGGMGEQEDEGDDHDDEDEDILSMGRQESRNMIQTMMNDVARIHNSRGSQLPSGKNQHQAVAAAATMQLTKKGNNQVLQGKTNGAKKTHGVPKNTAGTVAASSSSSGHAKKSAASIVSAAQGQGLGTKATGGKGPARGAGGGGMNKGVTHGGGHAKESMLDQASLSSGDRIAEDMWDIMWGGEGGSADDDDDDMEDHHHHHHPTVNIPSKQPPPQRGQGGGGGHPSLTKQFQPPPSHPHKASTTIEYEDNDDVVNSYTSFGVGEGETEDDYDYYEETNIVGAHVGGGGMGAGGGANGGGDWDPQQGPHGSNGIPMKKKKGKKGKGKLKAMGTGGSLVLGVPGGEVKMDKWSAAADALAKEKAAIASRFDVEGRHRAKLAEMQAKRKENEDEVAKELRKAELRRKKFKEALLEKALKARVDKDGLMTGNEGVMVEEGGGAGVSIKRPPMRAQAGGGGEVLVHGVPASQLAGSRSCPEPSGGGVTPAGGGGGLITVSGSVKAAVIARRGNGTLTNATNVIQDTEEHRRQEEERIEAIAVIRRKFKEQHKNILMSLVHKNREEEKKVEEAALREEEKRRRWKMKADRLAARRAEAMMMQEANEGGEGEGEGEKEEERHGVPMSQLAGSKSCPEAKGPPRRTGSFAMQPLVAGSGMSLARAHRAQSAGEDGLGEASGQGNGSGTRARETHRYGNNTSLNEGSVDGLPSHPGQGLGVGNHPHQGGGGGLSHRPTQGQGLGPGQAENEEDEKARKVKRIAAKLHQARVAAYLIALAEQKKKEDEAKRRKEERQRKRAVLLSSRIQNEGLERKLMSMEDKTQHQGTGNVVGPTKDGGGHKGQGEKGGVGARPRVKDTVAPPVVSKPTMSRTMSTHAVTAGMNSTGGGGGSEGKDKDRDNKSESRVSATNDITTTTNRGVERGVDKEGKPSLKVSAEAADAMVNRLSKVVPKDPDSAIMSVPARDFNDWKRKNAVPPKAQVFAMTGWYPCVKQALLDRGWYFNPDATSPYFDLKWTLRSIDVSQETLQPWQLTNHFLKNVAITTKVGLIKSLQSLVWLADVSSNDVIPRGYDLSLPHDTQAFIDDFRCQKAESWLKTLYKRLTGLDTPDPDTLVVRAIDGQSCSHPNSRGKDIHKGNKANTLEVEEWTTVDTPRLATTTTTSSPSAIDNSNASGSKSSSNTDKRNQTIEVNVAVFEACCGVLERLLRPQDDDYLDMPLPSDYYDTSSSSNQSGNNSYPSASAQSAYGNGAAQGMGMVACSPLEWELIGTHDLFTKGELSGTAPEPVDAFLRDREASLEEKTATTPLSNAARQREHKRKSKQEDAARLIASENVKKMMTVGSKELKRVHRILCKLRASDRSQSGLNGKGLDAKNIWIVKPAAKSRGRGIQTFCDLPKLLKYVDAGSGGGREGQWVVQKYMENPLIIAKRKFDLRQWVLVTDWNPLTIYFYDECYARFSVAEYSCDESTLGDTYVHLVNNSITKTNEHFHDKVVAEDGVEIQDCMWGHDDLSHFLKHRLHTEGKNKDAQGNDIDILKDKIHPRMKDIAKWSLMCASEMIEHRKNSWELYGFDYMVDDDYNAWLIEINSSPACDYSTKITSRYVQKALVELLDVVIDVRQWEASPRSTRGDCPDTGGWECIHKGPLHDMPVAAFGTDMTVKGETLKVPPRPRPPMPTPSLAQSLGGSAGGSASSQGTGSQGGGGSGNNHSGLLPLGAHAGGSGTGLTQEGQGLGLTVTGSTPTTFTAKGSGLAHNTNGSTGTRKTTAPSSSSGPSLAALNNGSRKTVAMGGGRDRVPVTMNTISFGVQGNGSNGGNGGNGGVMTGGGSVTPSQFNPSTAGIEKGITPLHSLPTIVIRPHSSNGQGDSSEKEEILTQEQYLQGSPSREEIELAVGRMDQQAVFCDSLSDNEDNIHGSPQPPRMSPVRPLLGSRGMSPGSAPLSPRARAASLVGASSSITASAHSAPAPAAKSAQSAFFFDTMSQYEKDTHKPSPNNLKPAMHSPTQPKEGIASSGKAGRGGMIGGQGTEVEGGMTLTRLNFDDSDDEGQGQGGGKMMNKGRPPANPSILLAPTASVGMTLSARGQNTFPAGGQGLGQGVGSGTTTAEAKKKLVPIKTFSVDF